MMTQVTTVSDNDWWNNRYNVNTPNTTGGVGWQDTSTVFYSPADPLQGLLLEFDGDMVAVIEAAFDERVPAERRASIWVTLAAQAGLAQLISDIEKRRFWPCRVPEER